MILTKWNVGLRAEAGKDLDLIYGLFTKEVMLKNKWNLAEEIEIQDINKDVYELWYTNMILSYKHYLLFGYLFEYLSINTKGTENLVSSLALRLFLTIIQ